MDHFQCVLIFLYVMLLTSTDGVRIIDRATGRCLDSNSRGDVYTLDCNGGDYQKWKQIKGHYIAGTYYTFVNYKTGNCLDSNYDEVVYAMKCNNGNYQKWLLRNDRLVNLETHLVLDSNSKGKAYMLLDNGGNYQKWDIRDLIFERKK